MTNSTQKLRSKVHGKQLTIMHLEQYMEFTEAPTEAPTVGEIMKGGIIECTLENVLISLRHSSSSFGSSSGPPGAESGTENPPENVLICLRHVSSLKTE
jgi:hypothetical protein